MTCTGIAIGILVASGLSRLLAGMLYGVRPTDLPTFAFVVLTLGLVATVACYIPARRAMKIDPLVALRDE